MPFDCRSWSILRVIKAITTVTSLSLFATPSVADAQEAFSYIRCVKTPADNPKQRIRTTFKFNANSLFIFSDVSHKYIDFCAVKAPCRVDVNDGSINGVFDWVSRKGKRIININRLTGAYFQIDTYEDLNDPLYGAYTSSGSCVKTTDPEKAPVIPKF